jgi:hypothetical protein
MAEVVKLPAVFQRWENIEAILHKHLDGYLPEADEEFIIARFKEIVEHLHIQAGEISITLDGLDRLPKHDLPIVYEAIESTADQIREHFQTFAGSVLGEIFALVLEVWRTNRHSDRANVA